MSYRVSELQRTSLIRMVADWLDAERPLFAIYVDSIRGKGNATSETQRGEFGSDILEELISSEYFVDQVLETFGDFGGKLQLRAVFMLESGEPDWEHAQKKRFNLIPETPGSRTGSSGGEAATEQLSQSLSKGFDTMIRRHDEAQERTLSAMQDGGDRSERFFERLLELQAAGSNSSTQQAIALQEQIARANFAEFKLELVTENQGASLGALFIEALPHLAGSPLLSNVADLVGAYASRVAAAPLPHETPAPPPIPGADGA